jgi:hypothetical protein
MMTEYTFYQIECNGKRYVGYSKNFKNRIQNHKSDCYNDKDKNYNYPLYKYIRENGGWNSCQITILEKCNFETKQDANKREEYWRIEKEAILNGKKCFRTNEELQIQHILISQKFYQNNKDKLIAKSAIYYHNNKQKNQQRLKLNKNKYNKNRREKARQKRLKEKMLLELKEKFSSFYI